MARSRSSVLHSALILLSLGLSGLAGCSYINKAAPAPKVAPAAALVSAQPATIRLTAPASVIPALEAPPAAIPTFASPTLGTAAPASPAPNVSVEPGKIDVSVAAPVINLPVGEWWSVSLDFILALVGGSAGLAGLLLKLVPAGYRMWLQLILPSLLSRAIAAAHNSIPGIKPGDVLTVPGGNAVIATAAQWAIANGPRLLLKFVGGEQGLRDQLHSLLRLPADSSAADFGVTDHATEVPEGPLTVAAGIVSDLVQSVALAPAPANDGAVASAAA